MRALCVFSGGLDSMLAAELVKRQGIEVSGLYFKTLFFTPERAISSARHIGLPLEVVDISKRHLEVVKRPKHGYGSCMNPCIDCHALMFRIAGELLTGHDADFVITGEVLGQRPLSQTKGALNLVAKESGIGNLLLRPLSAKRLLPTLPEEKGWVNRALLLDLQGRSRKPQMALAEALGIGQYPSPAGGCSLTEKAYAARLRDLLTFDPDPDFRDIRLLKLGRHFRIDATTKVIVGRDRSENEGLRALAGEIDLTLTPLEVPGPTVLLVKGFNPEAIDIAARMTAAYCDAVMGQLTSIKISGCGEEVFFKAKASDKREFSSYLL